MPTIPSQVLMLFKQKMSKRRIANEGKTLLQSSKEYFRSILSGEWLRPDNSKLALLTPQQRIQQREENRKRIKLMVWGLLGCVAFGAPLAKRCKLFLLMKLT